jgi:Na+-driven multidrug efflux pump
MYGRSKVSLSPAHLRIDLAVVASVVRLSTSAILQMLIPMTSYIGVMRVLSGFGSEPLAGYTIGFRILMFAILPVLGLSNAAATLVGQNLGARRPDRAELAVRRACIASAALLTTIGVVFVAFAPALVSCFASDPTVQHHGVTYLRIISLGFPFYAFGMVVTASFNGAGDTRTPTLINLVVFWLLQLPTAYVLSHHASLGPIGVYLALAASFSVFAVLSVSIFRLGRWKSTKL